MLLSRSILAFSLWQAPWLALAHPFAQQQDSTSVSQTELTSKITQADVVKCRIEARRYHMPKNNINAIYAFHQFMYMINLFWSFTRFERIEASKTWNNPEYEGVTTTIVGAGESVPGRMTSFIASIALWQALSTQLGTEEEGDLNWEVPDWNIDWNKAGVGVSSSRQYLLSLAPISPKCFPQPPPFPPSASQIPRIERCLS